MLLQFVVENFLSFRDKAVLSMLAAEGTEHDEVRHLKVEGLPPVLKCAAIYGANASGKSNLVKAFEFARRLVVNGTKAAEPIPLRRFKLETTSLSASARFEFEIHTGGRCYSYGFVAVSEGVESEWLFASEGGKDLPLFHREQSSERAQRPAIALGGAMTQDAARMRFLEFVAEGTRPNQLFLTQATEHNVGELAPVANWFRDGSVVLRPTLLDFGPGDWRRLGENAKFRDYLAELLRNAGTGISHVSSKPRGEDWFVDYVKALNRSVDGALRGAPEESSINFHHSSSTGALIPFELGEESDGTRRLITLAPFLFDLHQDGGAAVVHVIDEIDRSLHPLLTRFFLDTFLRTSSAEHPGQLIFTTHDTNLLDLNVLGRESVWFTEKDAGGASSLYSLAEFKGEQLDRLGGHLEEGYLQGRFGAIPFLGDARRLGWTAGGTG